MSKIYSVNELNNLIKGKLEKDSELITISLRGEISNLTKHPTGHYYFSLKDEYSQIKAVMFRFSVAKLTFNVENGQKVIVNGSISVYSPRGEFSINVTSMEPEGLGKLYIEFEKLKNKLNTEGLFDESHKKEIPGFPYKVGVITSPTGAAIQDILNISSRRFPFAEIILYPALVQGQGSEDSLINGVRYLDSRGDITTIIIGRGGGSIEDLWSFNSEKLAREIYACKTPIVSGTGHEIDFTICDFVCDKRAPTPSAAAELVFPSTLDILNKLDDLLDRETAYINSKIDSCIKQLKLCDVSQLSNRLFDKISDKINDLSNLSKINKFNIKSKIDKFELELKGISGRINALSPLNILSRGYAIPEIDGHIIKSINEVKVNDEIDIKMVDGKIKTKVIGD